jgi:calcineurin-like phosphoesterase family protein
MNDLFIYSDSHFNHKNVLNFKCVDGVTPIRPGFKDVDEMNEVMIERWNSIITPQDKVYHLGDVYFGSDVAADIILSRLNGKKRLLLGNHDDGKDWVLAKHFQKIEMWRIFREFNITLTHVPIHPSSFRRSDINVHGHIHEKSLNLPNYFCACVERTNYTPLHLPTLAVELKEQLERQNNGLGNVST